MTLFKENDKKLLNIRVDEIIPNPEQPRKNFDEYELYKLSESIRINGIIQPLTVKKNEGGYLLIAGERRLRAARKAGLKKVPCIVMNVSSETAAAYSIIENLQRADLTLFEQAEGIQKLINDYGISHIEAAEKLGLAQSTLSNKLRILRLSVKERERITAAGLTERHARALIRIEQEAKRESALDKIIAENMSAKECEEFVEGLVNPEKSETKTAVRKSGIADVRLFSNSLNRLIDTLLASGIKATRRKQENKDYIEYKIRILKTQDSDDNEKNESPQLKIC